MNLYKSTGKKMEGWPQWVGRLVVEKEELILRNRKLEETISLTHREPCNQVPRISLADAPCRRPWGSGSIFRLGPISTNPQQFDVLRPIAGFARKS